LNAWLWTKKATKYAACTWLEGKLIVADFMVASRLWKEPTEAYFQEENAL